MTDKTPDPCGSDSSTELGERNFLMAAAQEAIELASKYAQEVMELREENRRFKATLEGAKTNRKTLADLADEALKSIRDEDDLRDALLPAGVCKECRGEGEQGGQFCGGYWKCESCGGTGKLATDGAHEWNVIDRLPEAPGVELEVFTQLQPEPRVIKFIPDAGQFFYQDCTHQAQNALFTEQRHIIGWRVKKQTNTNSGTDPVA